MVSDPSELGPGSLLPKSKDELVMDQQQGSTPPPPPPSPNTSGVPPFSRPPETKVKLLTHALSKQEGKGRRHCSSGGLRLGGTAGRQGDTTQS